MTAFKTSVNVSFVYVCMVFKKSVPYMVLAVH